MSNEKRMMETQDESLEKFSKGASVIYVVVGFSAIAIGVLILMNKLNKNK
jgi:hypothetical protein